GNPAAVSMQTSIGIRGPAARPARIFAINNTQQLISRLAAEVVLTVDRHIGLTGRRPEREAVRISATADDDAGVTPIASKAQHRGTSRITLNTNVARRSETHQKAAVRHRRNPVILMAID